MHLTLRPGGKTIRWVVYTDPEDDVLGTVEAVTGGFQFFVTRSGAKTAGILGNSPTRIAYRYEADCIAMVERTYSRSARR